MFIYFIPPCNTKEKFRFDDNRTFCVGGCAEDEFFDPRQSKQILHSDPK